MERSPPISIVSGLKVLEACHTDFPDSEVVWSRVVF